MNGPVRMYKLPPIIRHDFPVEIATCMYKLKNIHTSRGQLDGSLDHVASSNNKVDIFEQRNQEIPGMTELEARQNAILEQLSELRNQIQSIKCELKIEKEAIPEKLQRLTSNNKQSKVNNHLPECIILNANPSSPPYSLAILQGILQDNFSLTVTSYLHSSVDLLPKSARELVDLLSSFIPKPGVPIINLQIIWKNVNSNAELILSHTPIMGEVNFLRFLSRLVETKLSYDSDPDSLEIDSLLDHCYLLVRAKTKTEKLGIIQMFNKSLGKAQWLTGRNQPSIADVAAYSAVKQCLTPDDLGAHLGKWYSRCMSLNC